MSYILEFYTSNILKTLYTNVIIIKCVSIILVGKNFIFIEKNPTRSVFPSIFKYSPKNSADFNNCCVLSQFHRIFFSQKTRLKMFKYWSVHQKAAKLVNIQILNTNTTQSVLKKDFLHSLILTTYINHHLLFNF